MQRRLGKSKVSIDKSRDDQHGGGGGLVSIVLMVIGLRRVQPQNWLALVRSPIFLVTDDDCQWSQS